MVHPERFAEIRRWLDNTDDGGSLEWHTAVAALGEIQAHPQVSDWRPIETAPKDGTRILVGNRENGVDMEIVFWVETGWSNDDFFFDDPDDFSHWMPLPRRPDGTIEKYRSD